MDYILNYTKTWFDEDLCRVVNHEFYNHNNIKPVISLIMIAFTWLLHVLAE